MDEHELIRKSLKGDEEAFKALVLPCRQKVMQHCLELVHDQSAAEDLVQESFLHAYQHLDQFKMKAAFSTWVWRIAHNKSLNYLRKQKEVPHLKEELVEAPLVDPEMAKECLPLLPEKQRLVFEMFYIQQLSQKEIAKVLGIPHGTVRSRIHYAKQRLRHFF